MSYLAPMELHKSSNRQMKLAHEFLKDIKEHAEREAHDYRKWEMDSLWLNTLRGYRAKPDWDEIILEYVIHNYFATKLASSVLSEKGSYIFTLFSLQPNMLTIEQILEYRRSAIDEKTLPVLIELLCSDEFYTAILKDDCLAFLFWTRWIVWLHIMAKELGFDLYDRCYDSLALQITSYTMYNSLFSPDRDSDPFFSKIDLSAENEKKLRIFFYKERNFLVARIVASADNVHCRVGQDHLSAQDLYKIRLTCTHDLLSESEAWLEGLYKPIRDNAAALSLLCDNLEKISSEELMAYYEQDKRPLGMGFLCPEPELVAYRTRAFLESQTPSVKIKGLIKELDPKKPGLERRLKELFLGFINFIYVNEQTQLLGTNHQFFFLWNVAILTCYRQSFKGITELEEQLMATSLVNNNKPLYRLFRTILESWKLESVAYSVFNFLSYDAHPIYESISPARPASTTQSLAPIGIYHVPERPESGEYAIVGELQARISLPGSIHFASERGRVAAVGINPSVIYSVPDPHRIRKPRTIGNLVAVKRASVIAREDQEEEQRRRAPTPPPRERAAPAAAASVRPPIAPKPVFRDGKWIRE